MSFNVFSNNGSSLLASGITATSATVTVTAGQGALFPALSAGQVFTATLEDTSGNLEIVLATARALDTISITRAQEGTVAIAFASGSRFELRPTAAVLGGMLQKNGGDTLSGTTTNNGIIQQNTSGSIQGGEYTGVVRGAPAQTANQFAVPVGSGPPTIGGSPVLTQANFLNQLPSGVGVFQTGMICLWNGASTSVPTGFHVCDGTNGTPDLRDKFVLGAGGSLATSGGSASTVTGSTDPSGSLAIAGTALTIDQLPSHSHNFYTNGVTYSSNGHPAVIGIEAGGSYQANLPVGAGGPPANTPFIQTTGGSGGPGSSTAANTHTHTLSGSLAHAHTYALPPYVALFYIMKL